MPGEGSAQAAAPDGALPPVAATGASTRRARADDPGGDRRLSDDVEALAGAVHG
ncbi:hypothetical protein ACWEWG_20710 [Streptomyces sp. NPDC003758]|uniref:Uncharacterized protein n=1 Tax=Streptomyces cynarae TaxID=2981134 RepID=A0ABY6E952_9ACTN|nr:hypothetical protein [Streptomyces cynarae]UXY23214.1 hypothetical protein N8I84_34320 [Streptomyces cynarae]